MPLRANENQGAMRIPGQRIKRTRLIQTGKYVVAVDIEMVIPEDDPSEPCYESETVQLLREIKDRVERGDVAWLTQHGKLYSAVEAARSPCGARHSMSIKTIHLSRLEENALATLSECADSGQAFVVQLPDQRLIAFQMLELSDDDSLVDQLLESNAEFQALVAKSKGSPRKPFVPRTGP